MRKEERKFVEPLKRHFKSSSKCMFETQIKVRASVIDLLVFTLDYKGDVSETIGVEIKSNKDSFKRLHKQLSDYYSICNRVYVALEDKNPPENLPSFVGVLKKDSNKIKTIESAKIVGTPFYSPKITKTKLSEYIKEPEKLLKVIKRVNNLKKKLMALQVADVDVLDKKDFQLIDQLIQLNQ